MSISNYTLDWLIKYGYERIPPGIQTFKVSPRAEVDGLTPPMLCSRWSVFELASTLEGLKEVYLVYNKLGGVRERMGDL
jgi:hypothetical protein